MMIGIIQVLPAV